MCVFYSAKISYLLRLNVFIDIPFFGRACQSFRCVKTSLTYVRLFSRSYPIAVHIELKRKYAYFVRVFTLQG